MKLQFLLTLLSIQYLQSSVSLPTVKSVFPHSNLLKTIERDADQYAILLELQKKSHDDQRKIWWYLGGFILNRLRPSKSIDFEVNQFLDQQTGRFRQQTLQRLSFFYESKMPESKQAHYVQALKERYQVSDLSIEEKEALSLQQNKYEQYEHVFLNANQRNKENLDKFYQVMADEFDQGSMCCQDVDDLARNYWIMTGKYLKSPKPLLSVVAKQANINEIVFQAYKQLFEDIASSEHRFFDDLKTIFTAKEEIDKINFAEEQKKSYFNIVFKEHLERLTLMNKMPC